ncbi:MAG: glycosyltransferase family 9 protein [Flavipsychrobacter sp.]
MKILVIRFSSIGDIVLTTPIVRCIKQQKEGAEIHFLTKAAYKSVLEANPYIDKFHLLHEDLDGVVSKLQAEKFDYVIDLHNNLRTLRVKRALNVESFTFSKLNFRKWLLVNFKLNLMPDKSIVERYFDAISPLEVKNDGQGLDYFIPETTVVGNKDIPMSHWGGYAGAVIGGSYNTKKLPVSQWKKFCSGVPYPVILLGGPEDRAEGEKIAELDPIKIYNACGKFDLNESAWLVKHARVVVSNDTGLMHIAAAFKKPIISLWGNTSPEMGMFPYYGFNNMNKVVARESIIMEQKKLYCHPCSKLGYNRCPEGHFKCMYNLNMDYLTDSVKKLWQLPNH